MVPLDFTEEQLTKLDFLAKLIAPHFYSAHSFEYGAFVWCELTGVGVNYLEFCLLHALPYVASKYVHDHIDCTQSWAERIISQKIAHEIGKVNPIDTLYDIYENPQDYKQNL